MHKDYKAILAFIQRLNPPRKDPAWVTISQIAESVSLSKDRVSGLIRVLVANNLVRRNGNKVTMPPSYYGTGIHRRTKRSWLPYEPPEGSA